LLADSRPAGGCGRGGGTARAGAAAERTCAVVRRGGRSAAALVGTRDGGVAGTAHRRTGERPAVRADLPRGGTRGERRRAAADGRCRASGVPAALAGRTFHPPLRPAFSLESSGEPDESA